jgi:hypothetical protein
MEINQVMKATVAVVVRMAEDGKVSGRLVGHLPYAKPKEIPTKKGEEHDGEERAPKVVIAPTTSAEVEFDDEDRVAMGTLLAEIVKKYQERLAERLGDARAEARRVARAMGELI